MRTSCGKNTDSINRIWRTSCQLGLIIYTICTISPKFVKTVVIDHLVVIIIIKI